MLAGVAASESSATSSPHTAEVGEVPGGKLVLSQTNLMPVVAVHVSGVLGKETGAAGSFRAGNLGLMCASIARAFSSALPHSRQVILRRYNA